MPRTKKDEDLFNQSSMSFLEHLDELRVCMIGAIMCVVVGLLISVIPLGFAPSMATMAVDYVQRPLKKSLENYHILQSQKQLEKKRRELLELGYSEEVASLPSKLRMTAKTFYIFPQDLETLRGSGVPATTTFSRPEYEAKRLAKLDEVDNFASFKNVLPTQTSLGGVDPNEPISVILWEKIADDPRTKARSLSVQESFLIFLKTALFLGVVLGSPGVFYYFWRFVGAGLYPGEKKYVYRFLPLSIALFLAGFSLAFFVVFEFVLSFLFRFNAGMNIEPDARISEWLNFASQLVGALLGCLAVLHHVLQIHFHLSGQFGMLQSAVAHGLFHLLDGLLQGRDNLSQIGLTGLCKFPLALLEHVLCGGFYLRRHFLHRFVEVFLLGS